MSVGLKWVRHLVCLKNKTKKNLWAVSRRRKPSLSTNPSKNSPSSSLARVCFITLVIPTMRRSGEAAVLYIWTRRLARRLFLLLFPASIYEVHTLDRPVRYDTIYLLLSHEFVCFFVFLFFLQRCIIMTTNNSDDFHSEYKKGNLTHTKLVCDQSCDWPNLDRIVRTADAVILIFVS
jgi:hypothetical protein